MRSKERAIFSGKYTIKTVTHGILLLNNVQPEMYTAVMTALSLIILLVIHSVFIDQRLLGCNRKLSLPLEFDAYGRFQITSELTSLETYCIKI